MTFARLLTICSVTAGWAVSFGIGTQATSHWLKAHDASDSVVGLVHAAYYLGVAVAAIAVPRLTRRFGLGVSSLGLFASAASLVVFPFVGGPVGWLLARAANGAACALSLIPLETYLSRRSAPETRAKTFSYFAVALTVAGAVGIALGLEGFNPDGLLIRLLGRERNAFFLAAIFPMLGSMVAQHSLSRLEWDSANRVGESRIAWTRHTLSFGTAWGQGFLEGGMLAFLSLDLVGRGLSTSTAGLLMGIAMVGAIAFQIPVAHVADRLGRQPTLLACYAVAIAALILVPMSASFAWLGVWLFLLGACSAAMYPLGLALLDAQTPASGLARAYSWYLAIECVGSQLGAAAMGRARDAWGGDAMFAVGAVALIAVLAVWLALDRGDATASSHADDVRSAA